MNRISKNKCTTLCEHRQ